MHRKYRPWHYAEKIRQIHEAMPDAAIGADVMTGFPGETDELFAESYDFIEHLPFTYLHVFTYSSRPGTSSAEMEDQVPVAAARERNRLLRELAARKNLEFRKRHLGKTLDVITLQSGDGSWTEALSDNYLKVKLQGFHPANHWIKAAVTEVGADDLAAAVQEEPAMLCG
jgi:threonylcarbamoyladenosine tRNA methylthiotransferase MtaB